MEKIVDDTIDMTEKVYVPIEKKINLTIKEAAEYSNIGINKIAELLRNPMCNFVLYIGNRKLVKRKEFEQYLSSVREILFKVLIKIPNPLKSGLFYGNIKQLY